MLVHRCRLVRYWILYLTIAVLAWAFGSPWLALIALGLLGLGRLLPDPVELWRSVRSRRELLAQVRAHPGDLLARRRLARMELHAGRARQAVALFEEVIAKGMTDDEVFYLLGLARLRAGDPSGALEPLVRSVRDNPRLLYGEPYFTAAEALLQLGRLDEAEDALERGLEVNGSYLGGYVRLGRVRAARGDRQGARSAYRTAVETWWELPEYLRWKTLLDYVRARWELLR